MLGCWCNLLEVAGGAWGLLPAEQIHGVSMGGFCGNHCGFGIDEDRCVSGALVREAGEEII